MDYSNEFFSKQLHRLRGAKKLLEVIKCVTLTGAEILGRDHELGTLAVGRLGDVLVVDGDVVADISILQNHKRLIAVMQSGIIKSRRGVSCLSGDAVVS